MEMYQIKKRLLRAEVPFIDKNLKWGANVKDYEDEIQEILNEGKTPVAVELAGAENISGVSDIDHHGDKAKNPASLTQVMERMEKPMSFIDELIAANDSEYIPGMERKFEEHRAELEKRYGSEKFEKLKTKLITLIRAKDRQMQGVTQEQEENALEAIKTKEVTPSGVVIVRIPDPVFSPVQDFLYPTWAEGKPNLIVVCNAGKEIQTVIYSGRGDICKAVKEHFSGFGAGSGYGDPAGWALGGCQTSNPDEVINFITNQYQKHD